MDRSRIEETVKQMVKDQLKLNTLPTLDEVVPATYGKPTLNADSLDMAELMMFTEDTFGIEIKTESEWLNITTVEDIVKLVEKYTS